VFTVTNGLPEEVFSFFPSDVCYTLAAKEIDYQKLRRKKYEEK